MFKLKKRVSPEKISDSKLRKEFAKADTLTFLAKPFNSIEHRKVDLSKKWMFIPFQQLLSAVRISPEMLRAVFKSPINNLPPYIETYDILGSFPFDQRAFRELAKILNKKVRVVRQSNDICNGGLFYAFTAYPSGRVAEENQVK